MKTKQQATPRPWKLWECEQGARWSTKYDDIERDGDTCYFSGHAHDHKIKLVRTTEIAPHGWFRWAKETEKKACTDD